MHISGVKQKELVSFDGTRIRYQDIGEGPVIVLANGLGGTYEAWVHMINHLRKNHRILSWDYRGMYGSETPRLSNLRIVDHVRDMELILKAEGVANALLVGWSMGTQVVFEFYRNNPEVAAGLMIICGAAGRPFDTALNFSLSKYILPPAFRFLQKLHKLQGGVIRGALQIPGALEIMKVIGMLAKEGDLETFKQMAGDYSHLDFEAYNQIMLGLGDHDAWDVLPSIKVPTMIFTADQDFFTPDHVSEKMHNQIRGSKLVKLHGAGHYAPLEFPERFNEEIDDFFQHHVGNGYIADGQTAPETKKKAKKTPIKKAAKKPAKKAVKKTVKKAVKKTVKKTPKKVAKKAVKKAVKKKGKKA